MESIFLNSDDGIRVAINHYNSESKDSVIIICPGWYMCKDANAFKSLAEDLFKYIDIISMDFRGHGKSSGFFTFSAKEYFDLKAVYDYAIKHYKKIILMGFSLGGATSIIYASKYKTVQGLVLVSAPADFSKIENRMYKVEAFWPTIKKFELWRSLSIRPGNILKSKIKPIDVINEIPRIPKLFIAGSKDPTVFPWHAQELFNKAVEPKSLEIFKGGFHAEDLYLDNKDKFLTLIKEKMINII
ncbi:MAG: alpha/beta fold hydrolase [Cyanobacteriota bacterium]